MTNEEDQTIVPVAAQIETLRRLEQLNRIFRQEPATEADRAGDPRVVEYVKLQEALPPTLFHSLRSRIRTGQRLVAAAPNGKCGACYTSIPRGDRSTLVIGREALFCQYCGVLLHEEGAMPLAADGGGVR